MDRTKPDSKSSGCQRRFKADHYVLLSNVSMKGEDGIKKWNEWRMKNPNSEILLEGASFEDAYLEGANLKGVKFCPESERGHTRKSFIKGYNERIVNLRGANLRKARLQNAILNGACLKETEMSKSYLQGVDLMFADLEDAMFLRSDLRSCVLEGANIRGADITRCDLRNANFRTVIVDGATTIWKPKVNKCKGPWRPERVKSTGKERIGEREYTDFQGVGLDDIRIDPGTKQLLKYNIRRKNWEQWYLYKDWSGDCKEQRMKLLQWLMFFVRAFWLISDYGLRTWRIIVSFCCLSVAFAVVYWLWPCCVTVSVGVGEIRSFWHALYFSVVTITTLGFGDIAANPDSWWGQTLLMSQVIFGYILLGALVTRFAVLFTVGGPVEQFADEKIGLRGKLKRFGDYLKTIV